MYLLTCLLRILPSHRQELVWHDVQGAESHLNKSVRNAEEAEVVCDWAHALHRADSKKWKVGWPAGAWSMLQRLSQVSC